MNSKKEVLRKPLAYDGLLKKTELIRICKKPDGTVVIDLNQNIAGRGAYVKKDISLFNLIKKKKMLNKALKCDVDDLIYEQIYQLLIK